MRTYANFLLFEDVLTNLPNGANSIKAIANSIMNPIVEVTSQDCGTFIGTTVEVDYSIVGRIELVTNQVVTADRIYQLMAQGITTIKIRDLHSCIAPGGICSLCYESTTGYTAAKNEVVTITSEFIYTSDIIIGDGISNSYLLSQTPEQYSRTSYNPVKDTEVSSISSTNIIFNTIRTPSDIYVLHYYAESSDPFLEYIAKSYSGGLLGIAPLPSFQTILRPSLYQRMFSDNQVSLLRSELIQYAPSTPQQYIDYCDIIRDPLEKILFIIYLYAIYANVQ